MEYDQQLIKEVKFVWVNISRVSCSCCYFNGCDSWKCETFWRSMTKLSTATRKSRLNLVHICCFCRLNHLVCILNLS